MLYKERATMLDPREIDQRFHILQDEIVHEYEEKLKRNQAIYQRKLLHKQKRYEHLRTFFQDSPLDFHGLERLAQQEKALLQDFLRQERPLLVERPSSIKEDGKNFALSSLSQPPNLRVIPLYATTLLASDPSNLEGNPGKRGNPYVNPDNPGQVKIRASWTGSGSPCTAQPSQPQSDASAVFSFVFTPFVSTYWHFSAFINMHGFYTMRAASDIFGCTKSIAQVTGQIQVNQYGQVDGNLISVLDLNQSSVDTEVARIDYEAYRFTSWFGLAKGDPVYINVVISIHTEADSDGSYSEVNFAEGTGNYLQPVTLHASTAQYD